MRRLATILLITVATAAGSLYWLHDGDLAAAVEPLKAEWNADVLAADAGVTEAPPPKEPTP